ncbi:MAG: hypothetical protein K2X87_00945 [Gemmataceae bacterium]|nr:hypothetical protein [Gemmataceae bacterium]
MGRHRGRPGIEKDPAKPNDFRPWQIPHIAGAKYRLYAVVKYKAASDGKIYEHTSPFVELTAPAGP